MDLLKQQMRYMDEYKVAVNCTKKLGGGTELWILQLKWNKELGNSGKVEVLMKSIWKPKKAAKVAVYFAKQYQAEQFASINKNSDKNRIFKIAKRLKWDNADVVGKKCIWNDEGKLTLTVDGKPKAWQSHYQKLLLNVEFLWNASNIQCFNASK